MKKLFGNIVLCIALGGMAQAGQAVKHAKPAHKAAKKRAKKAPRKARTRKAAKGKAQARSAKTPAPSAN